MKVLDRLGINGCFEQISCFETMNPNLSKSTTPEVLKPSMEAMKIAIDVAGVDPRSTLFLDDNVKNVAAVKAVELRIVLVGKAIKSKEADCAMESIPNLVQVIPEIWFNEEDDQMISHIKNEMDSILSATTVSAELLLSQVQSTLYRALPLM